MTRNSSSLNYPDIPKPAPNPPESNILFHETSSSRDLYKITLLLAAKPVVFTLSAFCCKQSQKVLYISGSFWGEFLVNLNTIGEPQFTALISPQFFECSEQLLKDEFALVLAKNCFKCSNCSTYPACFKQNNLFLIKNRIAKSACFSNN